MPDQAVPQARDGVDIAVRNTNRIMTCVLRWISKHWLLVANISVGSLIVLPVMAPILMHFGLTGIGNLIYTLFKPACHQLPERSFFLFGPQPVYTYSQLSAMIGGAVPQRYVGSPDLGYKIAVCERDVAIYGSMLLTGLLFGFYRRLKTLPLKVFGLLVLPMLVDGFGQLFGFWSSTWQSRVITGGLFGIACIWLAYPYLQQGMQDIYNETLYLLKDMAPPHNA
jgi:uncharacterized membrane protein